MNPFIAMLCKKRDETAEAIADSLITDIVGRYDVVKNDERLTETIRISLQLAFIKGVAHGGEASDQIDAESKRQN